MNSSTTCPYCFQKAFDGTSCHACGYHKVPRLKDALHPFTILHDRYRLGVPLGMGGFGISYMAYDTRLQKRVVIKEYFPKFLKLNREELASMPIEAVTTYNHGKMRFKEEAELLTKLRTYHFEHIISAYDAFDENQNSYYVMDLVEGYSLKELSKSYHLSEKTLIEILVKVAKDLSTIHKELHILHRDISPDNILVDAHMRPVLIDFGSAKILDGKQGFSVVLKKHYAPLEQYSKTKLQGPYSDVYALAATAYYLLTGHYVQEATMRAMNDTQENVRAYNPKVSEQTDRAIMHALEMKIENRTPNMDVFIAELTGHEIKPYVLVGHHKYIVTTQGLSVGRHEDNEIIFKEPAISKHHFEITFDQATRLFTITDFSKNGTFVNGRLLSHQSMSVKAGAVINIPGILEEIRCEVNDE